MLKKGRSNPLILDLLVQKHVDKRLVAEEWIRYRSEEFQDGIMMGGTRAFGRRDGRLSSDKFADRRLEADTFIGTRTIERLYYTLCLSQSRMATNEAACGWSR